MDVSVKKESESPDCHWHHAVAMRKVLEIIVSVLQCLRNKDSCPSLCKIHHGIMPHPARDFGAYLMARGVCRLKPIFARIMDAVLASAFASCLWSK